MAARKSTPVTETPPPDVSVPEPTPEPEPVIEIPTVEVLHEAVDAASAQPSATAEPVRKYQAPTPAPFRAGGHVLTGGGWVLDTDQKG